MKHKPISFGRFPIWIFVLALLVLAACSPVHPPSADGKASFPAPRVPDSLGVNIHFTVGRERELDMIRAAGFRIIRHDMLWEHVEKEKGRYDFQEYDQLVRNLRQRGLRPFFILAYNNRLYPDVRSPEGRAAFTRFAAAAARRYRGLGIIWEVWNEPNTNRFWPPAANPNQYMALAKMVMPTIRENDPSGLIVGPALSRLDPRQTPGITFEGFLEACLKQGLLRLVDGITIHFYQSGSPEGMVNDYRQTRAILNRYRGNQPAKPILSGEWGYPSLPREGFSDITQGLYLARSFLVNLSLGIPVSIWYDWQDDGPDPNNREHRFGTVTQGLQPKRAYREMQRLTGALGGMRFVKRLASKPQDWFLVFSNGRTGALAAWTTGRAYKSNVYPGRVLTVTGSPSYVPLSASVLNKMLGQ